MAGQTILYAWFITVKHYMRTTCKHKWSHAYDKLISIAYLCFDLEVSLSDLVSSLTADGRSGDDSDFLSCDDSILASWTLSKCWLVNELGCGVVLGESVDGSEKVRKAGYKLLLLPNAMNN